MKNKRTTNKRTAKTSIKRILRRLIRKNQNFMKRYCNQVSITAYFLIFLIMIGNFASAIEFGEVIEPGKSLFVIALLAAYNSFIYARYYNWHNLAN